MGHHKNNPKRRLSQTCKDFISDELEGLFDPPSGKTERELQLFAYLMILKDIIISIKLLR
jgi:hypothetical protein